MVNPNALKARKAEFRAAAEKLVNSAMESGKDLQGAELAQYDAHIVEIKGIEALLARHAELAVVSDAPVNNVPAVQSENVLDFRATAEYNKAFNAYMRTGRRDILAALNITTPGQGGYVTPQTFETKIIERLQDQNVMRQISSVIVTSSDTNFPVENNLGSASWTAEAAVAGNDNGADDNSFTRIILKSNKLTRIIKISEELLHDAFFDLESYLARKFASAFAIAEEAAFVNGSGSGQPTGVLAGASAGITTASPTAIASDELINLFYSLKRAYRANAKFLLNDSTALLIRKLKDTTNQYLWQRALTDGAPDTILGKEVLTSDAMPAAASTTKALLFGDFSYYQIADRTPRTFTRLNELYAGTGQVGFRAVERTDGALTLSEAVTTLTMHV